MRQKLSPWFHSIPAPDVCFINSIPESVLELQISSITSPHDAESFLVASSQTNLWFLLQQFANRIETRSSNNVKLIPLWSWIYYYGFTPNLLQITASVNLYYNRNWHLTLHAVEILMQQKRFPWFHSIPLQISPALGLYQHPYWNHNFVQ